MDFIHKLMVPPTEAAVTHAEAYEQIEGDETFDAKLDIWIPSATRRFERMTRRALMPQTWLLETEDAIREIELPRPPLIEIVSVYSKDALEDDWVAVDEDDYTLQENRSPARLTWVDSQPRFIQVTYRAGYESAADIPADYKHTILQLVAFASENRGDVEAKLPIALKAMIAEQTCGTKTGFFAC